MSFARRTARKSRFASAAKAPARDWIFGVVNFGSWVLEAECPFQPLTIFWLTPDGRPLLVEPVRPQQLREKAVESFYRVIEKHEELVLPSRVRVRVSELHHALAAGLPPEIDVLLTSTPEADVFIEEFSQVAANQFQKLTKLTPVAGRARLLRVRGATATSEAMALAIGARRRHRLGAGARNSVRV